MKRRNLFLSLISSVLVAIAIVTVTIVTVIQPKKKNEQGGQVVTPIGDVNETKKYQNMNEFERNGSEEYPYVIYSAESFVDMLTKFGGERRLVTKPVTEIVEVDGKQVETVKKDSDGYVIFEKVVDENGNNVYDVYNFELVKSIDFSEMDYVTLFNNGKAFIANIDGNDFSLNNISMNVTKNNIDSDFSYRSGLNRYARIAIFGEMNGSEIKDLNINNLNVNVANDVYGYVSNESYAMYAEMVTSTLAGVANDVTLSNVDIDGRVAGSSYIDANVSGNNAVGGVAAIANNFTMTDSKVNVAIAANSGNDYLVGGVAGYGKYVVVNNSEVSVDVATTFSRRLVVAGMFAYAKAFEASNVNVNLTVSETAKQSDRDAYVKELTANSTKLAEAAKMSKVAGIVAVLRANDSTQETTLTNINVNANVDFDAMFAGAVMDVYSTNKTTFGLVELHNVIVTADVNVLAAHAFARQLVATTVSYDKVTSDDYYNIKLTGDVKLAKYTGRINVYNILTNSYDIETVTYEALTALSATDYKYVKGSYKDLYIQASENIDELFETGPVGASIRVNAFGGYKVV